MTSAQHGAQLTFSSSVYGGSLIAEPKKISFKYGLDSHYIHVHKMRSSFIFGGRFH